MISKLSGCSRWLPIFRMISKLSRFFQMTANFPDVFKTVQIFQMTADFPDDFKTVRIFLDDYQFSGWIQNCPDLQKVRKSRQIFICDKIASPHLLDVKIGSPHLHDVSFEGPLTCWMSVLRVPSLAGCQFLEGPLTCLDVMWSLFWSKLDLKMKIWPTSGRFGENCLLKLVLVCPILTQWWNKTSQELRMLSRSLSDCKSLLHNVMIQVSQFIRNGQLCH